MAGFDAAKASIQFEAVEAFRGSSEYVTEVGNKAAAKIHDTYPGAEKYLKERPDGGFDYFVDYFLTLEEEKDRIIVEATETPHSL